MEKKFRQELFIIRLKELMRQRGVNQSDIQRKTGISNQSVSYWLSAQREPKIPQLCKLADLFGCSLEYLTTRDFKQQRCRCAFR